MLAATATPPVTPLVVGGGNCTVTSPGTRLFVRLREALASHHYSRRTEGRYCEACYMPYVSAFIRYPSAGGGL